MPQFIVWDLSSDGFLMFDLRIGFKYTSLAQLYVPTRSNRVTGEFLSDTGSRGDTWRYRFHAPCQERIRPLNNLTVLTRLTLLEPRITRLMVLVKA